MIDTPDDQETPEQRLARIQAKDETPEQRLARIQAQPTDPMAPYHAAYKSGALQRGNETAASRDQADINTSNRVANWLATMAPVKEFIAQGRTELEPGHFWDNPFNPETARSFTRRTAIEKAALDQATARTEAGSPRLFGKNNLGGEGLPFIGNPLNPKLSTVGQVLEAAPVMAALPGSNVVQAFLYGAGHNIAEQPADQRSLVGPLIEGGTNAALAKAADLLMTGARAVFAKKGSDQVMALKKARTIADNATDQPSYATAEDQGRRFFVDLANREEAANAQNAAAPANRLADMRNKDVLQYGQFEQAPKGATGPATVAVPRSPLAPVLDSPGIKPYADLARSFEQNQGADDATIFRETYKLMSEAQSKKIALTAKGEFAAAPEAQLKSIGLAKERMRAASPEVMPDFNAAVDQHRILSGELVANKQGYGAAQRLAGNEPSAQQLGEPPKPNGRVPDANYFQQVTVPEMTATEARRAAAGAAAGLKSKLSVNPVKDFRLLSGGTDLLSALDQQSGESQALREALKRMGVVSASQAIAPARATLTDILGGMQQPSYATPDPYKP